MQARQTKQKQTERERAQTMRKGSKRVEERVAPSLYVTYQSPHRWDPVLCSVCWAHRLSVN